jgi:hypothetical protein
MVVLISSLTPANAATNLLTIKLHIMKTFIKTTFFARLLFQNIFNNNLSKSVS